MMTELKSVSGPSPAFDFQNGSHVCVFKCVCAHVCDAFMTFFFFLG